ncbi:hypothetical protein ACI3L1_07680 [Deinococcus sp. SM5_A1]|uniref:hypothetical protein n=1 Tax=Deinococcus sp. SM5_A1 TaxID=3379094 RepID=UPI00385FF0B7
MTLDDVHQLDEAGVRAPADLPAVLASKHFAASSWLVEAAKTPEAASRILLAPQVLGEKPPSFGWMDAVMGLLAVSTLILIAMTWLGILGVVDPLQTQQVTVVRDLPAYHRLLSDDLKVLETPRVKHSFSTVQPVVGRLTILGLKKGNVLNDSAVTSFDVPQGSAVTTVIAPSVPGGLAASQKMDVIWAKGRASARLLAQRPVEKSVHLDIIVSASEASDLAGQNVAVLLPTR